MGLFAEQIETLAHDVLSSCQSRAQYLADLKADTHGFLRYLRAESRDRAKTVRTQGEETRALLQKETRALLKRLRKERKEMAADLKENLSVFTSELRSDVHNLMGKYKLIREELAEDLRAAHDIWADRTANFSKGSTPTRKSAAAKPALAEKKRTRKR